MNTFCIKIAGVVATNTTAAASAAAADVFGRSVCFLREPTSSTWPWGWFKHIQPFYFNAFYAAAATQRFPPKVFPGRVIVSRIIAFLFSSESRQQLRTSLLVDLVSESRRQVESGAKLPVRLDQLSDSVSQENRTEQNNESEVYQDNLDADGVITVKTLQSTLTS